MTDLRSVKLSDILPDSFFDSEKLASYAEAQSLLQKKIYDLAKRTVIYMNLESLPDPVLDEMAAELRAQFYSTDLDKEVKAGIIRNAVGWHIRAGTVSAVQKLVETIFSKAEITEWYEYGGRPFNFKVLADTSYKPDTLDTFNEMLYLIKTSVSNLDTVEVVSEMQEFVNLKFGNAVVVRGEDICVPGIGG